MEAIFAKKDNFLNVRRKFERRIWKFGEQFSSYANEKRLLSAGLNLCDEEFVEYLVDGIPHKQLQIQAKLQNFKSAGEVTRAFRTVELPRRAAPKTNLQSGEERLRCYNCNCSGHIAKECSKPKREYGTCFACGERGHFAASCKNYKKSTSSSNFNA
ncbi:uncharacterized protein LOC118756922 [Rhagoletis pomonella]|uniref:uncharacterized protein LOC118756922 n=1 Tax=Rhagoletis pomonella TaxID=28610 RepID=UPI0017802BD0|nr:uncharacterized protein LOC118756922 [Rhagoletis pomonella]